MKEQSLTFGRDQELYIHTPMGLIVITRIKVESDRKLRFRMPDFCTAFKGKKEELLKTNLVEERNGKLYPKFHLLAPVVGPDGELQGLVQPAALRLKETSDV